MEKGRKEEEILLKRTGWEVKKRMTMSKTGDGKKPVRSVGFNRVNRKKFLQFCQKSDILIPYCYVNGFTFHRQNGKQIPAA